MAYTYLDLTNEVLARFNEVTLTAGNFNSARGFQIQCKNAVNEAIRYLNNKEYNWYWNHNTKEQLLTAGTTRYAFDSTAKLVDFDTFRIKKDNTLGSSGAALRTIDYKEYIDRFADQEDDTSVAGGLPKYVFRTPDNQIGFYPYPDKAYTAVYEFYAYSSELENANDVPVIPEQYRYVIADGATAFAYQYRGEMQQYGVNFSRFEEGIKQVQSIVLNRYDYVRSTLIVRSNNNISSAV